MLRCRNDDQPARDKNFARFKALSPRGAAAVNVDDDTRPDDEVNPALWAPFVMVGEPANPQQEPPRVRDFAALPYMSPRGP
jgi:hypothetical protein